MLKLLSVAMLAGFSLSATAAEQFWDFSSLAPQANANTATYGNTLNLSSGGIDLSISAWADTAGANDDKLASSKVWYNPGWGLQAQNQEEANNTPHHSIDSYDYRGSDGRDFDMVLLSFSQAVSFDTFSLGWASEKSRYSRADVSLLSYQGAGDAATLSNQTWSSILATGWGLESNYSNVPRNATRTLDSDTRSTHWLIGAANNVFGGSLAGWADGFKLAGVNTSSSDSPINQADVPEPASLAIFSLALFGLVGLRRRR